MRRARAAVLVAGLIGTLVVVAVSLRSASAALPIGHVTRATVVRWVSQPTRAQIGPVAVTRVEAGRLAAAINTLPRRPDGESACGADTGVEFRVRFGTQTDPALDVVVDGGGCLGVRVLSRGRIVDNGRWDPDGTLRSELSRDVGLRST